MNKGKMIDQLAADCRISKKQAGVIINSITCAISTSLSQGRKMNVSGLGVFSVYERAATKAVDPRNREVVLVASRTTARLKTSIRLMHALNEELKTVTK